MFRFKCNTCGKRGGKRQTRSWATRDRNNHLKERGKETHNAIVIGDQ